MMGGHGIVGGHIPVGVGLGFAHKYKEDGGVAVIFFGDGAVGQGAFHEAMNLAALYELPVVFVIENNMYAMGTAVERAFAEAGYPVISNAKNYRLQDDVPPAPWEESRHVLEEDAIEVEDELHSHPVDVESIQTEPASVIDH